MPIDLAKAMGGGASFIHHERALLTSGNFVAPVTGTYLVTCIGGGGSGAWGPQTGNGMAATGGGAGGFSQKKVALVNGDVLTVVIGAGGASPSSPSPRAGNPGGASYVTGPGISLVAGGGGGGQTRAAGSGTVAGAVGGTASGGDTNRQGGGSGTATTAVVANSNAVTGGGAVAIYGVGYSSGDASTSSGQPVSTGGAGVGGKSGSFITTANGGESPGGSALKASPDFIQGVAQGSAASNSLYAIGYDGGVTGNTGPAYQSRMLAPKGAGGATFGSIEIAQSGCGTVSPNSSDSRSGLFAGSAAMNSGRAGVAYVGPGGGGSGASLSSSAPAPGGIGMFIVEWFEELA